MVGQSVSIEICVSEYVPIKITSSRSIAISDILVKKNNMCNNDLYEVELNVKEQVFTEIVRIRNRKQTNEYRFTIFLRKNLPTQTFGMMKFIRKIEQLTSHNNIENMSNETIYIPALFPEAIIGKIDDSKAIIFVDHKWGPIITPIRVSLAVITHYLGCYFADGTKASEHWRIVGSTCEQARYYLSMYKTLIYNLDLNFRLTFTKPLSIQASDDEIRTSLVKYWQEVEGINLKTERIQIRETELQSLENAKLNKNGALSIIDNRMLVIELHCRLLKAVISALFMSDNREYIWKFLCGVLEGDGSIYSSKGNEGFAIAFSSNETESQVVTKMLDKLKINYSGHKQTKKGMIITIFLIEVLKSLKEFYEDIFRYYPKRRQRFIIRLLAQKTVQELISQREDTAPFAKALIEKNHLRTKEMVDILHTLAIEQH